MFAFPPTAQYGEIKRPAPKHQGWYVGDKAKALPIVNQNWGPLSHEPENQLLERGSLNLPDAMLGCLDPRHHRPLGCYPQTVLVHFLRKRTSSNSGAALHGPQTGRGRSGTMLT